MHIGFSEYCQSILLCILTPYPWIIQAKHLGKTFYGILLSHLWWIHFYRSGGVSVVSLLFQIQSLRFDSYLIYGTGRLRGLAVACWTTDHYHPCSNPGMGISEGCFIFHFVSLPLEVARPI